MTEYARDNRALIALLLVAIAFLYILSFFSPTYEVFLGPLTELDFAAFVSGRSGTNLANQIFWLGMGGVATLLILSDPKPFFRLAGFSWPLLALCLLAIASVLWSGEPGVTFRRAFRALLPVYVLLVAIAYVRNPRDAIFATFLAFWALLLQNAMGLVIPGTFDLGGNFTGSAGGKNVLGQWASAAILIGIGVVGIKDNPLTGRLAMLAYFLGWLLMLVLSFSKTSMGLIALVPVIVFLLWTIARSLSVSIGPALLLTCLVIVLIFALIYAASGLGPLAFARTFVPDLTFTGRVGIWQFIYSTLGDRIWFGYGFGAYWGIGEASPILGAKDPYMHFLDSAHSGYLDLVVALGYVGLAMFVLVLFHYSIMSDIVRMTEPGLWWACWTMILFVLLHNTMESSIFTPKAKPLWLIFLLCVLVTARAAVDHRAERVRRSPVPNSLALGTPTA